MDNLERTAADGKKSSKKEQKFSKSGREIKIPKRVLPTSSDEAPPQKRTKSSGNIDQKLNSLKVRLQKIQEKRTHGTDVPLLEINKNMLIAKEPSKIGTVKSVSKSLSSASNKLDDNSSVIFDDALAVFTFTDKYQETLEGRKDENGGEKTVAEHFRIENCSLHESVLKELQGVKEQNEMIMHQLKLILEKEEAVFQQNCLLLKELEEKNVSEGKKLSQSLLQPLTGFPLHTVDEFIELDAEGSKDKRRKLYTHLVNLGGSKLREFLNCAMRETMTDELVCKFSWLGGEHGRQFGDTKVANVLYQAAKNCSHFRGPLDKEEFKLHMKEVFRCTKQRFRKYLRKNLLKDSTDPNAESTDEKENLMMEIEQLVRERHILSEDEDLQPLETDEDFADDES